MLPLSLPDNVRCMRSGILPLFTAVIPAPTTVLVAHKIIEWLNKLMANA